MSTCMMIPMAGAGQRFFDAGYTLPKPLIPVGGIPMVIRAIKSLPECSQHLFLVRRDHADEHQLDQKLLEFYPQAKIVIIDRLTEGQASTCLLGMQKCEVDESLLIGPCDNGMIYDLRRYERLTNDPTVDAIIWTFRDNPTVIDKPEQYGWVKVDGDNALRISCKKAISTIPIRDHAIVGTFTFKRAGLFFEAAQQMIRANRRINNEFYIDEVMNIVIENRFKVKVFEIDSYIGWGTINDLKTYQYWQSFFDKASWHPFSGRDL